MTAPLRLGIVGAGFIADVIASAVRESEVAVVAAVASRKRQSAASLAARHDIPAVFGSWEELMGSADVDAVYCATPTSARESICVAAAEAGKHVLAEKPFANADSLERIIAQCRLHAVAFLDATHFVHHPRHQTLKRELDARIGRPKSIHSSFFFPSMDPNNIRMRPDQEPTGAIGDMAWYCMRAIVEFTPSSAALVAARGFSERHPVTGSVVRGAGVLQLSDGCTSTWEAGYSTGASIADLAIQGDRGMITQDDFVLDWAQSVEVPDESLVPEFVQRAGIVNRRDFAHVQVPSELRQSVLMVRAFAALARSPRGDEHQAYEAASLRTQTLVDAIWKSLS
ncbi:MAG: Gfo/Idh/MocA family oxidoreductase [Gemmatimonadaceae bacterium]